MKPAAGKSSTSGLRRLGEINFPNPPGSFPGRLLELATPWRPPEKNKTPEKLLGASRHKAEQQMPGYRALKPLQGNPAHERQALHAMGPVQAGAKVCALLCTTPQPHQKGWPHGGRTLACIIGSHSAKHRTRPCLKMMVPPPQRGGGL